MSEALREQRFFEHRKMDFELRVALGSCIYGVADAGEVLATAGRIRDDDFDSWFDAFRATAERLRTYAESARDRVSAREAYFRAANYESTANQMVDGTRDPSRQLPTWRPHMDC